MREDVYNGFPVTGRKLGSSSASKSPILKGLVEEPGNSHFCCFEKTRFKVFNVLQPVTFVIIDGI
jgi:hypothetical protein